MVIFEDPDAALTLSPRLKRSSIEESEEDEEPTRTSAAGKKLNEDARDPTTVAPAAVETEGRLQEKGLAPLEETELRLNNALKELQETRQKCEILERQLETLRAKQVSLDEADSLDEDDPTLIAGDEAAAAPIVAGAPLPRAVQDTTSPPSDVDYFKVMRPFGKEGFNAIQLAFDYSRFDAFKAPLFHEVEAVLDLSRVPYQMLNRFIRLLPSDSLRLFSYTCKHFYQTCLSLRGIEVQVMYTDYQRCMVPKNAGCLENGRLIVVVSPETMCPLLRRFFPCFRTTALLLDLNVNHPVEDEPVDYIVKDYSTLYAVVTQTEDMDAVLPFLHGGLKNVEIKSHSHNFGGQYGPDALELVRQFQDIKTTNFSFQLHAELMRAKAEELMRLLVQYMPVGVKNLYFSLAKQYPSMYWNSYSVHLYDAETDTWTVQAKPEKRPPSNSSVRGGFTNVSEVIPLRQRRPR